MIDVVRIAAIVPRGILRLGSRRSPLRFEPAMIPVANYDDAEQRQRKDESRSNLSPMENRFRPGLEKSSVLVPPLRRMNLLSHRARSLLPRDNAKRDSLKGGQG